MIDEITDYLFGLKMTIVSGVFLLIAVIFMIFNIQTPFYLNPAWATVIISGIPMLLLATTRLIREKWISSALLIAIAMIASLLIGEVFAAGEVAWIMALGALLEDWTVERAKKGLKNLIDLTPQTGRRIINGKEEVIQVDEIKIGDNDTLAAIVAESTGADLLVLMSDIDGLYDKDPHKFDNAVLIRDVFDLNDDIMALGGDAGTARGTGGMATKLQAAKIANSAGCDMIIMQGDNPESLYSIIDGNPIGTKFHAKRV